MIYWNANFQIPNSGVQSADVFVKIENFEKNKNYCKVDLKYYIDDKLSQEIKSETLQIPILEDLNEDSIYDYLVSLEEFSNYTRI